MAIAHLSVKIGKVGKGAIHAEYIEREGKYKQRLNQGEKLEARESGNMPYWAKNNPNEFWRMADLYERKNGSVYREHEIALPRELNKEQRIELVRKWVKKELGENHAYTWAIHNKIGLDGKEQPHVHLMFSDRLNDGIERSQEQYFKRFNPKNPSQGGCRKANYQATFKERKEAIKALRQRWETMHNEALSLIGIEGCNISMLSYVERGIKQVPQPKMLPSESSALHLQNAINRALKGYKSNGLETLNEEEQKTIRSYYESINKNHNSNDNKDKYQVKEKLDIKQSLTKPIKEKKIAIEKRLEALIASGGELSALERKEAKTEYEMRLNEAKELENLLHQWDGEEQRAKRELDEAQKTFERVKNDYEKSKQAMVDAEKRIAKLDGQILGKWRNGEEIERLKGFLLESQKVQQRRRAFVEDLEESRQKLCQTIDEANAMRGKVREDLKRIQPAISALGDLLRLAQVAPDKRKAWEAEAVKRGKWYEGNLPSWRESQMDRALREFESPKAVQSRTRGRGFSR